MLRTHSDHDNLAATAVDDNESTRMDGCNPTGLGSMTVAFRGSPTNHYPPISDPSRSPCRVG